MAQNGFPVRMMVLVAGGFAALAALFLWMQRTNAVRPEKAEEPDMKVPPIEIEVENQQVELAANNVPPPGERERVRKQEVAALLGSLAPALDPSERRAAALRLEFVADESAEPTLLKTLNDPDSKVAERCAKALLNLWRYIESPPVSRVLSNALSAYEAGHYDEALESLNMCASLDPRIPDLYRLRAEILLEKDKPQEALEDCRRALALRDSNFMALYVQAKCYRKIGDGQAALQSINRALELYGSFQEAYQLKVEIISLQQAGEL